MVHLSGYYCKIRTAQRTNQFFFSLFEKLAYSKDVCYCCNENRERGSNFVFYFLTVLQTRFDINNNHPNPIPKLGGWGRAEKDLLDFNH